MITVHLRVNDNATGRPTPVRLQVSQDGVSFAPLGRLATFSTAPGRGVGAHVQVGDSGPWWYIDGACEVPLPPGTLRVRLSKGPEYRSVDSEVALSAGQLSLRLAVDRWIDLRSEGWYAGDTHALFLSPHAAMLEAQAEDLAVVNLLACHWQDADSGEELLPNMEAFSGTQPALHVPGHMVVVNTLNSHPSLGTLGLLNCHRAVFPLRLGHGFDWTLDDWCGQCHRKTGLVVWAGPRRLASEALANLLLGQVDAFEVVALDEASLADWYALLDVGVRVPIVAGSAKTSNGVVLGRVRTYAHLPPNEELSYAGWIEAVRRGRTFVTNGPLLSLRVDGQEPGAVIEAKAGQPLIVEANATSGRGTLEVLFNGAVMASATSSLTIEHPATESGWLAARWRGEQALVDGQLPFAQTSAVYVTVDGQPMRPLQPARDRLAEALAVMESWTVQPGHCVSERQQRQLLNTLREARQRLDRPV